MKTTWTIGKKLTTAFVVAGAITFVVGFVGYGAVREDRRAVDDIGAVRLPGVDNLHQISEAATAIKVAQRTLLVPDLDAQTRQRQYDNVTRIRGEYQAAWDAYAPLEKSPDEAALWAKLAPAWDAWKAENNTFFEFCHALDQNGIHNPARLCWDLARFRGDHYKLREQALEMVHGNSTFEGGEDHTQCGFGKWLAGYQTANAEVEKALKEIAPPHQRVHAACKQIKQLVRDGKMEDAAALYTTEMAPAAEEFLKDFDRIAKEADAAQAIATQAYQQSVGKCRDTELVVNDTLDQLVDAGRNGASQTVRDTQQRGATVMMVMLTTVIAGVAAALTLGLWITRGIRKALAHISAQLDDGANEVNDAAAQVASAAQQLAEGASEQASSLEETSSALEEMAAMTRTSAENAGQANELADQTRVAAERGDKTTARLGEAMTAINQSSDRISKVIKVIEEIAFQTNLLALNAAVEAARAGEHGKGFAVVAEEVRNLAQRAAQATKETTSLIEDSVTRAREGSTVSAEVAQSLGDIVGNAAKTTDLLSNISRASQEQAQGVEQINTAVSQMDKVTQQNAAGAEESASAAEQLSAQAQTVRAIVGELATMVGGTTGRSQKLHRSGSAKLRETSPTPGPNAAPNKPRARKRSAPVTTEAAPAEFTGDTGDLKDF